MAIKNRLTLANNPLLSGPALHERQSVGLPYREIPISSIERDPNQPRVSFDEDRLRELADSIKQYGVLSPILVQPSRVAGKFKVIAGERRLRASKMLGLEYIPALVDAESESDGEKILSIQLVENLQRSDLTSLERAHAIGALRDTYSLSVREIAARLGISKSMVQRSLEILELPDDLLNALREGAAESKVLMLAKISDPEERAVHLRDIDSLTRDELKINVEKSKTTKPSASEEVTLSPEDRRIAEEIQRAIGVKAKLSRNSSNSESGKVILEFYSGEDLQEIFRRLVAVG